MPDTIDAAEERRLLQAVKEAVDDVDAGSSPDAAVEKVARANDFGPGKIRLVAQAYNTGRQTAQWREQKGILDKLAAYPLCDPERVISAIFAGPTAAEKAASCAVSSEYARGPDWIDRPAREKRAAAPLPKGDGPPALVPDSRGTIEKAYGKIDRAKHAADEASRLASASLDEARWAVSRLVGYFRKAAHDRLPFATTEEAARTYLGKPASDLLDLVYTQAKLKEKRAGDKLTVGKQAIDLFGEPFSLIGNAINSATKCNRLTEEAAAARTKLAETKVEALLPFSNPGSVTPQADPGPWTAANLFKVAGWWPEVAAIATGDILATKATHEKKKQEEDPFGDAEDLDDDIEEIRHQAAAARREKKAFMGAPAVGAAMGTLLGRTIGPVSKSKDDMVDDAWMDLEDPDHANQLRKIRAHATINQLMTDPDDPISGHEPDKVLAAYNEIAAATPRLAENVATLRPALRKRLEAHQEPFEAKELLDIEHGLARTKMPTPNTNILSGASDKLLG